MRASLRDFGGPQEEKLGLYNHRRLAVVNPHLFSNLKPYGHKVKETTNLRANTP